MSNAIINLCWPVQLPVSEKAVLMVFADAASDNGLCWLRISTVCVKTCLADRSVQRAILSLESKGLLKRKMRDGRSSVFYVIISAVQELVSKSKVEECLPVSVVDAEINFDDVEDVDAVGVQNPRHSVTPPRHSVTHNPFLTLNEPKPSGAKAPNRQQVVNKSSDALAFEQFWAAWPRSPNKKRKAEAKQAWDRGKIDKVAGLVMRHVRATIQLSDAATRDGGQYLISPRRYLQSQEWDDVATVDAQPAKAVQACGCGVQAIFRVGHRWFCQSCFDKRDR